MSYKINIMCDIILFLYISYLTIVENFLLICSLGNLTDGEKNREAKPLHQFRPNWYPSTDRSSLPRLWSPSSICIRDFNELLRYRARRAKRHNWRSVTLKTVGVFERPKPAGLPIPLQQQPGPTHRALFSRLSPLFPRLASREPRSR